MLLVESNEINCLLSLTEDCDNQLLQLCTAHTLCFLSENTGLISHTAKVLTKDTGVTRGLPTGMDHLKMGKNRDSGN